jgi:hypothetical protein
MKALIEAGVPWEKQEELYAAEFGVERCQRGLLNRFKLGGLRNGGFRSTVFKKRSLGPESKVWDLCFQAIFTSS